MDRGLRPCFQAVTQSRLLDIVSQCFVVKAFTYLASDEQEVNNCCDLQPTTELACNWSMPSGYLSSHAIHHGRFIVVWRNGGSGCVMAEARVKV